MYPGACYVSESVRVKASQTASDNGENEKQFPSDGNPDGAGLSVSDQEEGKRFVFTGHLTVHHLHDIESELHEAVGQATDKVVMDVTSLDSLDTNGALLINQAALALREKGVECSLSNSDDRYAKLLETTRLEEQEEAEESHYPAFIIFFNNLGRKVCEHLELTGQLVGFLGKFLVTLFKLAKNPGEMRWTSLVFHMEQVGIKAVPIVTLLTFLIGMVVAYMGAEQLQQFGAEIFAVNLLEVTVLREMAVLITSIVVAGRSSSSFTAQIGAMVANEEVDAMRSMGLDPDVLLVVPRVLALILCLPMLVFIADFASLVGGASAIWYTIGLDYSSFITEFRNVANVDNFFVGMVKTPFFAVAIGLVGCFQGFRATTSAESVGMLTTVAVVQAIFLVIVLDALFAIFFTTIGV